jgi:hypothetical protein
MKESKNKSLPSMIYDILANRDFLKELKLVYHYTSLQSLHKILTSRCLHFSHCSFMQDYTEFEFGFKKFQEKLGFGLLQPDGKKGSAKDLQNSIGLFIGSFTALKDSLGQWRSYASSATGIAIGFDIIKLDKFCIKKEDLFFGSVVYLDDLEKIYSEFIGTIGPYLTYAKKTGADLSAITLVPVSMLSAFIKHSGYKEEAEIRIIAGSSSTIKNKFHKGIYIPYAEIDFGGHLLEIINEIWIGPAANQELVRKSIELMLRENSLLGKCNVEISQIPFRLIKE